MTGKVSSGISGKLSSRNAGKLSPEYALIDGKPICFEKRRILAVEPYEFGTKIIMEASHTEEEPIIYFTTESHERVMNSYLS